MKTLIKIVLCFIIVQVNAQEQINKDQHEKQLGKLLQLYPNAKIVDLEQESPINHKNCKTCGQKSFRQIVSRVEATDLTTLKQDSTRIANLYFHAAQSTPADKALLDKYRNALRLVQSKINSIK